MRKSSRLSLLSLSCAFTCLVGTITAQTVSMRQITASGTGVFTSGTSGGSGFNKIDPALSSTGQSDSGSKVVGQVLLNRSLRSGLKGAGVPASMHQHSKSNPVLDLSIDGLNFYQQITADNGNQFSLEPPDQGLCAGNGYVLESTNDVLRAFRTSGEAASGTVSLNQFYGYAPSFNRSTGAYGPFITDPSCYFDQDTQRWFHIVLTLDVSAASGSFAGPNHLDLAVSQTASPLGKWTIYHIPVQDDGSQRTPNHNCPGGPCLGDYPHIGADTNGIYLTTNEFPFFANGYIGSQIYAISKTALASGSGSVNVFQYNTADASAEAVSGLPGFTVWPAESAGPSASEYGGTEYFLSSLAVFQNSGIDQRLQLWSLTNTSALKTGGAPALTSSLVNTEAYAVPGFARQPGSGTDGVGQAPGGGDVDFPLGQCLNMPSCSTNFLGGKDRYLETISQLNANDSRMQQVFYANGKLWASLGTGISYGSGAGSAGLAYFILHPTASGGTPQATVSMQGYLADPNLDMTYGTVAVTQSGRGVISFTATGPSNYPGVGFAGLDDITGVGEVKVAAAGVGVNDGFTGYQAFGGYPRWGDYGAAAVDGNTIWFAQEYIGQSCSLNQYQFSNPLGTCNKTRGVYGNWGTWIAQVTP